MTTKFIVTSREAEGFGKLAGRASARGNSGSVVQIVREFCEAVEGQDDARELKDQFFAAAVEAEKEEAK
jgi:hypothetical protein